MNKHFKVGKRVRFQGTVGVYEHSGDINKIRGTITLIDEKEGSMKIQFDKGTRCFEDGESYWFSRNNLDTVIPMNVRSKNNNKKEAEMAEKKKAVEKTAKKKTSTKKAVKKTTAKKTSKKKAVKK